MSTTSLAIIARWSVVAVIGAACTGSPPQRPAPSNTPAPVVPAPTAAPAGDAPPEPWYHDKEEAYADCVAPVAAPAVALPAPFEHCDDVKEGWSSPPGGNELHFHYREFSAATTTARRADTPGVCCYLIFEFPNMRPRD